MTKEAIEFGHQVEEGVNAIRPLLAGKSPELQSAILADLSSMWLCGLVVLGDYEATRDMRDWAFVNYMALIKSLVESGVNEPKGGAN